MAHRQDQNQWQVQQIFITFDENDFLWDLGEHKFILMFGSRTRVVMFPSYLHFGWVPHSLPLQGTKQGEGERKNQATMIQLFLYLFNTSFSIYLSSCYITKLSHHSLLLLLSHSLKEESNCC